MGLAHLGLILLLSLGLEARPQYAINTYPVVNKILDMPDPALMEVFQMSGSPISPPIYPANRILAMPDYVPAVNPLPLSGPLDYPGLNPLAPSNFFTYYFMLEITLCLCSI